MAKDIELPVGERASVFLAIVVCQRQQPSARTRHAHGHGVSYKTTQQPSSWLLQFDIEFELAVYESVTVKSYYTNESGTLYSETFNSYIQHSIRYL